MLVAANTLQGAAERRAQQHAQEDEYDKRHHEYKIVDVRHVGEVEWREAADRSNRLEVHADSIGAASELGVVEHEVEHLRECERDHDEVDALHPDDQRPDGERRQPRQDDRRRQRQPQIRRLVLGREQPQRVCTDAEIRRVTE